MMKILISNVLFQCDGGGMSRMVNRYIPVRTNMDNEDNYNRNIYNNELVENPQTLEGKICEK